MQSTTTKTLAFIGAMTLFGGVAFADNHEGAMEDAVTEADEAAEAEMTKAKEKAEAAAAKQEKMEEQAKEFTAEEIGGIEGESSD